MMIACDPYKHYFEDFTIEKYKQFTDSLERSIGHKYRFSTTPFILSKERFKRLVETTESTVRLLQSLAYQKRVTQTAWFLPQNPMRPYDYFGDVEFHISEDEEKIIEVNFNPPGHVGLLELLEEKFLESFDLTIAGRPSRGFERALVETVTDHHRYNKIAIGVNHTAASVPYYPHYKYIEKTFIKHGVDARVVYATDVRIDKEGYPVWEGEQFERIFNLLIVRVWQDNPDLFSWYTRAYELHPEMFFLNPLGWKLGNKSLLVKCHNLARESFGLSESDIENITRASLKTHHLSEFDSPENVLEEFGGREQIVLKQLDNYHVNGVAIRPSIERLKAIFETEREHYVAQQYFAPGEIPCIEMDGTIKPYLFSLRMGFLNGRFFGCRGYNFTFPATHEDITPVVVL